MQVMHSRLCSEQAVPERCGGAPRRKQEVHPTLLLPRGTLLACFALRSYTAGPSLLPIKVSPLTSGALACLCLHAMCACGPTPQSKRWAAHATPPPRTTRAHTLTGSSIISCMKPRTAPMPTHATLALIKPASRKERREAAVLASSCSPWPAVSYQGRIPRHTQPSPDAALPTPFLDITPAKPPLPLDGRRPAGQSLTQWRPGARPRPAAACPHHPPPSHTHSHTHTHAPPTPRTAAVALPCPAACCRAELRCWHAPRSTLTAPLKRPSREGRRAAFDGRAGRSQLTPHIPPLAPGKRPRR